MAITLVANAAVSPSTIGGSTTGPISTAGASLIVLGSGWYAAASTITFSTASPSNSISTCSQSGNFDNSYAQLAYATSPSTGSAQTASALASSSYAGTSFAAFGGAGALDRQNTNANFVAASTPGSITPSQNGCLLYLFGAVCLSEPAPTGLTGSITDGVNTWTVLDFRDEGSFFQLFHAWTVQAIAAPVTPVATWNVSTQSILAIASFLPASAPSGGSFRSRTQGSQGTRMGSRSGLQVWSNPDLMRYYRERDREMRAFMRKVAA